MINFFTDRNSKFIRLVELAGIVVFFVMLFYRLRGSTSLFQQSLVLYFFLYLVVRFCATWNWYRKFKLPKPVDEAGIRLHLKKTLVSTSYVLLLSNVLLLLGLGVWVVWIASFIYIATLYLDFILISMHLRDADPTPPNFFSRSFVSDIEAAEADRLKNFFPKQKDLV